MTIKNLQQIFPIFQMTPLIFLYPDGENIVMVRELSTKMTDAMIDEGPRLNKYGVLF